MFLHNRYVCWVGSLGTVTGYAIAHWSGCFWDTLCQTSGSLNNRLFVCCCVGVYIISMYSLYICKGLFSIYTFFTFSSNFSCILCVIVVFVCLLHEFVHYISCSKLPWVVLIMQKGFIASVWSDINWILKSFFSFASAKQQVANVHLLGGICSLADTIYSASIFKSIVSPHQQEFYRESCAPGESINL